MTHTYYLEREDDVLFEIDRKTKPRIGMVLTAYGLKWQVWYIEEYAGRCRARCEPV